MYKQILVPVQEPSEVEPLVRFAAQLLDTDGVIRVLHIIRSSTLPEVTREWRASVDLVVPAHEAAAALDVRVEPEVRASTDIPGEILETAESQGVDAILLTLRGSPRSRNPLVGHTASGILQHASANVLVVNRLALAGNDIPRILVATFRSEPPARTMALAEELSVRHAGVPVTALSLGAAEENLGPVAQAGTSVRGVPMTVKHSFFAASLLGRRRRLPEVILRAAGRERFGLLIVGEEEDRTRGNLLTRRFLEELFRNAPCPVLAIRD